MLDTELSEFIRIWCRLLAAIEHANTLNGHPPDNQDENDADESKEEDNIPEVQAPAQDAGDELINRKFLVKFQLVHECDRYQNTIKKSPQKVSSTASQANNRNSVQNRVGQNQSRNSVETVYDSNVKQVDEEYVSVSIPKWRPDSPASDVFQRPSKYFQYIQTQTDSSSPSVASPRHQKYHSALSSIAYSTLTQRQLSPARERQSQQNKQNHRFYDSDDRHQHHSERNPGENMKHNSVQNQHRMSTLRRMFSHLQRGDKKSNPPTLTIPKRFIAQSRDRDFDDDREAAENYRSNFILRPSKAMIFCRECDTYEEEDDNSGHQTTNIPERGPRMMKLPELRESVSDVDDF